MSDNSSDPLIPPLDLYFPSMSIILSVCPSFPPFKPPFLLYLFLNYDSSTLVESCVLQMDGLSTSLPYINYNRKIVHVTTMHFKYWIYKKRIKNLRILSSLSFYGHISLPSSSHVQCTRKSACACLFRAQLRLATLFMCLGLAESKLK